MAKAFKACPACKTPAKCARAGMCAAKATPKMAKGGTVKKPK